MSILQRQVTANGAYLQARILFITAIVYVYFVYYSMTRDTVCHCTKWEEDKEEVVKKFGEISVGNLINKMLEKEKHWLKTT